MKILAVAAALCLTAIPCRADVLWNFYETALTQCNATCLQPQADQPYVLFGFTLSGPDSTGHADALDGQPLVITGDPGFSFSLPIGHYTGTSFHMRWTEIGGQLFDVFISYYGDSNTVADFGLTGGLIASDNILGGCIVTQCTVTGYWADPPLPSLAQVTQVPEPSSLTLFGMILLLGYLALKFQLKGLFADTGAPPV